MRLHQGQVNTELVQVPAEPRQGPRNWAKPEDSPSSGTHYGWERASSCSHSQGSETGLGIGVAQPQPLLIF